MKYSACLAAAILAAGSLSVAVPAIAQERTVTIAGMGAYTGVVRIFGHNSEAAQRAAAERINAEGGITLADGSQAMIEHVYYDDRCVAEEGISVLRRIASTDALVAIGPTCSNVAEPQFGILHARIDDEGDTGLRMPVFTDVAIKAGLAQMSDWVFRNTPSERQMYGELFGWLRQQYPDARTVFGGVEEDFAHSRASWYDVMKPAAEEHGFELVGEAQWLLNDTSFSTQVRSIRRAEPDIIAISAHPFTTCGVLREMARQRVEPNVLVGLTSSSSVETLAGCAREAEGMIIPTSFAPVNEASLEAATIVGEKGGSMDLHSASAWENMMILRDVIDDAQIEGRPDTVIEDRRRIRDTLAARETAQGLLGTIEFTDEGEAIKPFLFVHVEDGSWEVLHEPAM
jgi:branched-chain amino acid transport system substrate-binding protein